MSTKRFLLDILKIVTRVFVKLVPGIGEAADVIDALNERRESDDRHHDVVGRLIRIDAAINSDSKSRLMETRDVVLTDAQLTVIREAPESIGKVLEKHDVVQNGRTYIFDRHAGRLIDVSDSNPFVKAAPEKNEQSGREVEEVVAQSLKREAGARSHPAIQLLLHDSGGVWRSPKCIESYSSTVTGISYAGEKKPKTNFWLESGKNYSVLVHTGTGTEPVRLNLWHNPTSPTQWTFYRNKKDRNAQKDSRERDGRPTLIAELVRRVGREDLTLEGKTELSKRSWLIVDLTGVTEIHPH